MNDRKTVWAPLCGLLASVMLSALDNFIVNPALPRIVGEFGGLTHLSWVMTAFMLSSTITMPLYGKFSDLYGRRALFVLSIVIFLVGSVLCGAAQSMTQLIIFRSLQGLGAGGTAILANISLADLVSPQQRARYQGLFNVVFTLSCIAGPVIGGLVTSAFGWRWVFYINLPIGLCALAVLWITLPERTGSARRHEIDYLGVALLTIGTVSFLLLLQMAEHVERLISLSAAGLAAAMIAAFAVLGPHERRSREPILAVNLLSNQVFLFTLLASAAIGLAYFGSSVFFPLYFQMVGGHSPAQSGLLLLPQLLAGTAASLLGGQHVARTGRYKPALLTGVSLVGLAFLLLAGVARLGLGDLPAIACMVMLGAGGGLCMPNMTVAMQNAIKTDELGVGTSSLQFCNQLAAVAGVALSGLLLSQRARVQAAGRMPGDLVNKVLNEGAGLVSHLPAAERGLIVGAYGYAFAAAFLTSAVIVLIALAFAARIPAMSLGDRAPAADIPDAALV